MTSQEIGSTLNTEVSQFPSSFHELGEVRVQRGVICCCSAWLRSLRSQICIHSASAYLCDYASCLHSVLHKDEYTVLVNTQQQHNEKNSTNP